MKTLTDEQIKALTHAFHDIDFNQPHAHVVYRLLEKTLKKHIEDPEAVTWREFRFYRLGGIVDGVHTKFLTISPKEELQE